MVEAGAVAEVLPTHTPDLFQIAVERVVQLLRAGEPVALPTETVYGLAANALDPAAVQRIFEVKGRPPSNPIIVHVASCAMARECVENWPELATRLAKSFWPGPLTMVLPRSDLIPDAVTAGGPTVGVRWPSHPFMQAVIRECGFPLAAPSANTSNRLSPTQASHVLRDIGDKLRLIVDGGQAQVGIESTVIDLSTSPPQLLRPGIVHEQALISVTGELILAGENNQTVIRSPGQLPKHYSPKARLELWSWGNDEEFSKRCRSSGVTAARLYILAHTHIPSSEVYGHICVIPHDPEAFARALYGQLHESDQAGAQLIVVESLPDTMEWRAIADRLRRASSP